MGAGVDFTASERTFPPDVLCFFGHFGPEGRLVGERTVKPVEIPPHELVQRAPREPCRGKVVGSILSAQHRVGGVIDARHGIKDPTRGALWYHADYVRPVWRRQKTRVAVIGRHIFYVDRRGHGQGVIEAYR